MQGPQGAVVGVSGDEGGGVVEVSGQGGAVGERGLGRGCRVDRGLLLSRPPTL